MGASDLLRERLLAVEAAVDAGTYHPGPWRRLMEEVRERPVAERTVLATGNSRVSRKLHRRRHPHIIAFVPALLLEAAAGTIGGVLMAAGIATLSAWCAVIGMTLWAVSFQPLIKVGLGTFLGMDYDYAYLWGYLEPRFKMNYGSYLAIGPFQRSLVHFAGMIGSPLAGWIAARLTAQVLPAAHVIALIIFWSTLAVNLAMLCAALAGLRRIGNIRLLEGSPTNAIDELQCWMRQR